jgi:hypothetical protein
VGVGADLFPADLVHIGRMGLWACGASFAGDAPRLYGGFRRAASRISPSLQTTLPMRLLAFILRLLAPWTWFGWKVASEPVPAPVHLKPFENSKTSAPLAEPSAPVSSGTVAVPEPVQRPRRCRRRQSRPRTLAWFTVDGERRRQRAYHIPHRDHGAQALERTMNTYETAAEGEAGRAQQLRLLAALGAWDRALRREELAAWCIQGSRGSIYTSGDGKTWVLHVSGRSVRHWSAVRAELATFATITQDGDDEGLARLHDLPAPEQAEMIREALGIRKRVAVTRTWRDRLRAIGFGSRSQGRPVSGARIGENEVT